MNGTMRTPHRQGCSDDLGFQMVLDLLTAFKSQYVEQMELELGVLGTWAFCVTRYTWDIYHHLMITSFHNTSSPSCSTSNQ